MPRFAYLVENVRQAVVSERVIAEPGVDAVLENGRSSPFEGAASEKFLRAVPGRTKAPRPGGDVIAEVDGAKITDAHDLAHRIERRSAL